MARPPRTFSSADFRCSQSISLREGLRRLQARYDFRQVVSTASRFAGSFYIITHALHGHETYGLSLETCTDSITVAMVSHHDRINVSPEALPCLENVQVLASLAKFPPCPEIIVDTTSDDFIEVSSVSFGCSRHESLLCRTTAPSFC